MDWLKLVHGNTQPKPAADFKPGDEIRVWYKILEGGKERLGQFEGLVIRTRGAGHGKTSTVRRVTYGEGVERIFPVDGKTIARIEVLRQGKVKRARLYYLRRAVGKTRIAAQESTEDHSPRSASGATKSADAPPADKAEGTVSAGQSAGAPTTA